MLMLCDKLCVCACAAGAEVMQYNDNNELVPVTVPVRMPDGQLVPMTHAQIRDGLPDGTLRVRARACALVRVTRCGDALS